MRYECRFNTNVAGNSCISLMQRFFKYHKNEYKPENMHSAIECKNEGLVHYKLKSSDTSHLTNMPLQYNNSLSLSNNNKIKSSKQKLDIENDSFNTNKKYNKKELKLSIIQILILLLSLTMAHI